MRVRRLVLTFLAMTAIASAIVAVQPRASADDAPVTPPPPPLPPTAVPSPPATQSSDDNSTAIHVAQATDEQINAAAPLPATYQALLQRSLFSHAQSPEATPAAGAVPAGGPAGGEAMLVFRGVGVSDDQRSAYIENIKDRKITRHRQGEPIAGGRIVGLTLDELVYESAGQTTRIRPGQNLAGQEVAPPPPPATQPAAPPNPGQPGGPQPPNGMQLPPGMTPEQAAAMQRAMMMEQQKRRRVMPPDSN